MHGAFSGTRDMRNVHADLLQPLFFYYRVVSVSEAQEVSLNQNCQFLEVSAAESYSGVQLAFHSLLKETRSSQLHRNLPVRRKLGVNSVSKVHLQSLRCVRSLVRVALIYIFMAFITGLGKYFWKEQ